jgi:hypothetical protein
MLSCARENGARREEERQLNLILLSTAKIHSLIVNTQDLGGGWGGRYRKIQRRRTEEYM